MPYFWWPIKEGVVEDKSTHKNILNTKRSEAWLEKSFHHPISNSYNTKYNSKPHSHIFMKWNVMPTYFSYHFAFCCWPNWYMWQILAHLKCTACHCAHISIDDDTKGQLTRKCLINSTHLAKVFFYGHDLAFK